LVDRRHLLPADVIAPWGAADVHLPRRSPSAPAKWRLSCTRVGGLCRFDLRDVHLCATRRYP